VVGVAAPSVDVIVAGWFTSCCVRQEDGPYVPLPCGRGSAVLFLGDLIRQKEGGGVLELLDHGVAEGGAYSAVNDAVVKRE
jgi:hypothetical protein